MEDIFTSSAVADGETTFSDGDLSLAIGRALCAALEEADYPFHAEEEDPEDTEEDSAFDIDAALDDITAYLHNQEEQYFTERGTTSTAVLSNNELLHDLAAEHHRCVTRYGADRVWSCKDACDSDPGIGSKEEDPADPDITAVEDETLFEALKSVLFMHGDDAVSDFLGYEVPDGEDKDAADKRLDEAYAQMPDEEYSKFLRKYGLITDATEEGRATLFVGTQKLMDGGFIQQFMLSTHDPKKGDMDAETVQEVKTFMLKTLGIEDEEKFSLSLCDISLPPSLVSATQKDAEWEAIIQFAKEHKDDLGPLTEEWVLRDDDDAPNVYQRQLLSLWTAYCLHNDLSPDTEEYDRGIRQIWDIISADVFPKDIPEDDDTESYCFGAFDNYMAIFLV